MACITQLWNFFCCIAPTPVTIGEPVENAKSLPLPDDILQLSFRCCSAKDLHNLALSSKRFRNLIRNDKVCNITGEEKFRNNQFWFKILQLQTPTILPYKSGLNYKNLYSLFIVKRYPVKISGSYPDDRRRESALHKKNDTTRCTEFLCVEKERSIFKFILSEAIASREEALKTILLMHSIFPLRTFWDEQGNEMRFCRDCRILVPPTHDRNNFNPEQPNNVSCYREVADFPPVNSLI